MPGWTLAHWLCNFGLNQRGLMAPQRYHELYWMCGYGSPLVSRASTTKRHRTRQSSVHSLSLSTGFERMSTSLVSPTALRWFHETIHCLKVETAHFVFFSVFLGTNPFEIVSNCSEDTILVKRCFPFKEAGTYWCFFGGWKSSFSFSLSESVQSLIPSLTSSGTFFNAVDSS